MEEPLVDTRSLPQKISLSAVAGTPSLGVVETSVFVSRSADEPKPGGSLGCKYRATTKATTSSVMVWRIAKQLFLRSANGNRGEIPHPSRVSFGERKVSPRLASGTYVEPDTSELKSGPVESASPPGAEDLIHFRSILIPLQPISAAAETSQEPFNSIVSSVDRSSTDDAGGKL